MRNGKGKRLVFMVIRPDTHSGMSIRADDHAGAAIKAMRYATMRGATEVVVRQFCGPAGTSAPVTVRV